MKTYVILMFFCLAHVPVIDSNVRLFVGFNPLWSYLDVFCSCCLVLCGCCLFLLFRMFTYINVYIYIYMYIDIDIDTDIGIDIRKF